MRIDWENKPNDAPVYMQVSPGDIVSHLTAHYGDCSAGARIYIENFAGLKVYHKKLPDKGYKFMRPGLEKTPWNPKIPCMEIIDAFGNRLTFTDE